ncbi:MAG: nitronate monooxygenase family protein [Victivallales bacterium]|nr:nitronate monooxygenase family protein [Victivallales bacterium]
MKLKPLKIRNLTSEFPVVQAGMGVRIGNATLAAEVVKSGGFGTIASVGFGRVDITIDGFVAEGCRCLAQEIRTAKELCHNRKPLGVNIMVALSTYKEFVEVCVREKVDFIISGAGLPLPLPEYVGDADIALIPVISSARALEVVVRCWSRKYHRKPDAIIIEGPKCGGHLGFAMEQIEHPETTALDRLLPECREVMKRYDIDVPVLAAGEIASRADIEKFIAMGYDGVQIGTYFITAEEAGIDRRSKEVFINATHDDIVIIKSPVGLPCRVLRTPLVQRVLAGSQEPFRCPYHCLRTCNPRKAPFCIAKALLATWSGDVENGLYMCGCNIDAVKEIYPVKQFFDTLKD